MRDKKKNLMKVMFLLVALLYKKLSAINEVLIIPYHTAVLAVELLTNDHQQDEGFNFDAPYSEDAFDLNLEAADHQQELQQMISKPQRNLIFFLTISLLK